MSGMEDTIIAATEGNINALIGGSRDGFTGLGPMAKLTIMYAAHQADANAKIAVGEATTRTSEKYQEMAGRLQEQFVLSVLGFNGSDPVSIQWATRRLVEQVYDQYGRWAQEAKVTK